MTKNIFLWNNNSDKIPQKTLKDLWVLFNGVFFTKEQIDMIILNKEDLNEYKDTVDYKKCRNFIFLDLFKKTSIRFNISEELLFNIVYYEGTKDNSFMMEDKLQHLNKLGDFKKFRLEYILNRMIFNNNLKFDFKGEKNSYNNNLIEEFASILKIDEEKWIEFLKIINNTSIILPSFAFIEDFFKSINNNFEEFNTIVFLFENIWKEINIKYFLTFLYNQEWYLNKLKNINSNDVYNFLDKNNISSKDSLDDILSNLVNYFILDNNNINIESVSIELVDLGYSSITSKNIIEITYIEPNFDFKKIWKENRDLEEIIKKINILDFFNINDLYDFIEYWELNYLNDTFLNIDNDLYKNESEDLFLPNYELKKVLKSNDRKSELNNFNKQNSIYNTKKALLLRKFKDLFEDGRDINYIQKEIKEDIKDFSKKDKFDILIKLYNFNLRIEKIDSLFSGINDLNSDEEINNLMRKVYWESVALKSNSNQLALEKKVWAIIFYIFEEEDFSSLYWNKESIAWFKSSHSNIDSLKWSLTFIQWYNHYTALHEVQHAENDIVFSKKYSYKKEWISYRQMRKPKDIAKDEIIAFFKWWDSQWWRYSLTNYSWWYTFWLSWEDWNFHSDFINKQISFAIDIKKLFPSLYLELLSVYKIEHWNKIVENKDEINKYLYNITNVDELKNSIHFEELNVLIKKYKNIVEQPDYGYTVEEIKEILNKINDFEILSFMDDDDNYFPSGKPIINKIIKKYNLNEDFV